MDTKTTREYVGVDLVGNRFVMCTLKADRSNPRYSSGRSDTEGGQLKFLAKLSDEHEILIPDSPLAVRALELLGERVHIASMGSLWTAWERAGVKRGQPMAKFAAIYLIEECLPPQVLTKAQIQQIQANHALELVQIMRIGDDSQRIGQAVLNGSATEKDAKLAIQNEYQSKIKPSSMGTVETYVPLFDEEDDSFLARLYRALEKLR
ncbi:hypothetical protein [Sphaerochaeta sp. PS]|uniref:hypothetical protein n=1 Tax=Sphaerochaeta sp. PS TaxID=3076336 RepID=UPI0028A41105|nr:hypothetical protein [Sphaerochaeta sp. PS]MDT4762747.1 hypothetical protein [Sphaerochaeta sp. PS]